MKQRKVPEIRFRQGDGTEFPAWEKQPFERLYKRNSERNSNGIPYDKTISIAKMQYNPEGNGASIDSLKTYKVLRIGDIAYEGHTNKDFQFGRFVLNDIGDGIISPRFMALRPLNDFPVSFWKNYIHREATMNRVLVHSTKKGTMMNELVVSEFLKQTTFIPSIQEQQKIGDFFTLLDHRITFADKKFATFQTIKKGMLQKIFSQELRFKDDDGNDFPAWTEKSLGDFASVTKLAGFEFTKYVTYKDEGKIIALRGLNVKNGSLVLDDVKYIDGSDFSKLKRSKLYKGDILFTYVGTIGESAIVDKNDAYYLAPNVALIRIAHESPQYALFYMQSEQFHLELNKYVTLTSQASLTMDNVRKIKIMLPVMAEQQKIAAYFATLDRSIAAAQKKAAALRTIKKGLLQKMFI